MEIEYICDWSKIKNFVRSNYIFLRFYIKKCFIRYHFLVGKVPNTTQKGRGCYHLCNVVSLEVAFLQKYIFGVTFGPVW